MDLDVLPGELLPDPAKARISDQLHGQTALVGIDFILQKGVHAKGVDAGVRHWYIVGQL